MSLAPPTYHIKTDGVTGRLVLFTRHALHPHEVTNRIEFGDAASLREIAEGMIEWADAVDAVLAAPMIQKEQN